MKNICLISICLCLIASACSPVSSYWSCKGHVKGSCKTINEIDNNSSENNNINLKNSFKNKNETESLQNNNISSFDDFRSKESVARVVFSPYVDAAGNRHDVSIVYYLEQKSEWRK